MKRITFCTLLLALAISVTACSPSAARSAGTQLSITAAPTVTATAPTPTSVPAPSPTPAAQPTVQQPTVQPITPSPSTQPQASKIGQRTKTTGCQANGPLPDSACSPGAIFATATKDQICQPGYSRDVRDVPESEKNQVYAEYGIRSHSTGEYEVDHLVSLGLGGSNDIANLWPEAAEPRPGYHEKDKVENYLHAEACSGAVPLATAQQEIATNWLGVFKTMPQPGATPLPAVASSAAPTAATNGGPVSEAEREWVTSRAGNADNYYSKSQRSKWETLAAQNRV
ncbi:MAG: hypothetical protein M1337_08835 [Actinobacteria bacterium]|nr:hypothetical protein [Actinomycetota bacterium]